MDLEDQCYRRLLEAGWIVAMTSYRKEGLVIREAIDDLISLREYIAEKYGSLKTVLLEGESMGGAIVTHINELNPQR